MKEVQHHGVNLLSALEKYDRNERNKFDSRYLRGNIKPNLVDALTGSVPESDALLLKFHGIYQQDNRENRTSRARRKLEPDYQFMVRLRIPGGRLTAGQWLGLDQISRQYAERGLRITTRQTIQLHGVRKPRLADCLKAIGKIGLDTIAACGDDSRGVVCGANPLLPKVQQAVEALAVETSHYLIPKTRAYAETWYDDVPQAIGDNEDPMYGPLYLPRKFKVGFVIPPVNDIDVFAQDLGFIAITERKKLAGFAVCVGGGMGQLDNRQDSYPRLAEPIGFIDANEAPEFAGIVMGIQRDYGNRVDRHRARFKYTLDHYGTEWFLTELAQRRGKPLMPVRPYGFSQNGDIFGWQQVSADHWNLTLQITSGRVSGELQDKLVLLIKNSGGKIRLTTNQNITLTDITGLARTSLLPLLDTLQLTACAQPDTQLAYSLSCVALPTCGLAMAESERYLPDFIEKFTALKLKHGLEHFPVTLRITGCPNGCARPYLAEIGMTGRAPGLYNLYLGGSFHGDRLNRLYAPNLNEEKILFILDELLSLFSRERHPDEYFGDYLIRTGKIDQQLMRITNNQQPMEA